MLIFCLFHLYYVYAPRLQLSWWLYQATLRGWWWEAKHGCGEDPHEIHILEKQSGKKYASPAPSPFLSGPGQSIKGQGAWGLPAPFQARSLQPGKQHLVTVVVGRRSGILPTPNSFLCRGSQLFIQRLLPLLTTSPLSCHVERLTTEGTESGKGWGYSLAVPAGCASGWEVESDSKCKRGKKTRSREVAHEALAGVKARGSCRALPTKGDPGPFMCFTKVAKLRWDYNCSSPCQGWKVGSLKYAPAVLMKSLKSNKREKRARKVTCITLIKEKSHREVVNLNHCLNFNLFINRICPSLRMLLLPLPLSNNSRHNERVWQKVKCLVINSFNWKKREEGEREVPLQEQKTEGLEEGARLKFAWRPSPRPNACHSCRRGDWVSCEALFSKINARNTLKTPCPRPPAPDLKPLARVSARSFFGWSI